MSDSDSPIVSAIPAPKTPPAWASDPQASIPLGFLAKSNGQPERFWLGTASKRALVLLDEAWRTEDPEAWVGVAAGAFKALCGYDCDRPMAQLIAKGWLTAVAVHQSELISQRVKARILVPQHTLVQ